MVVGDTIEAEAYQSTLDRKEVASEAMALGKQYLLQGRLQSTESVSSVLFDSAVALADNRGLFDQAAASASPPTCARSRSAFPCWMPSRRPPMREYWTD